MSNLIDITLADDPRIAPYQQVKERDLVGREGFFIAEGEVVLRLLVQSDLMETHSVLVTENRVESLSLLLALLPAETPVYVATQNVMDSIVGFHIHRGILALGRRRNSPTADELLSTLPRSALVVGLVGISNHDNMGGIFRNAAAFGASAVIADALCCDPLYRKSIRVSVGAALRVPFAKLRPGENIVDIMLHHGITPLALTPSGATTLSELRPSARPGLLLGAEGPGLPENLMTQCTTVSIPMAPGFDSLNVATASGIVMYHLRTGKT